MVVINISTSITESEMWKQEIKRLEDENIRFKTRLAGILANNENKHLIEPLENFQNRFLKMDEQLTLLKHDVREQLHLLQTYSNYNARQLNNIRNYRQRLEAKMQLLRQDFYSMADDFNSFTAIGNV